MKSLHKMAERAADESLLGLNPRHKKAATAMAKKNTTTAHSWSCSQVKSFSFLTRRMPSETPRSPNDGHSKFLHTRINFFFFCCSLFRVYEILPLQKSSSRREECYRTVAFSSDNLFNAHSCPRHRTGRTEENHRLCRPLTPIRNKKNIFVSRNSQTRLVQIERMDAAGQLRSLAPMPEKRFGRNLAADTRRREGGRRGNTKLHFSFDEFAFGQFDGSFINQRVIFILSLDKRLLSPYSFDLKRLMQLSY